MFSELKGNEDKSCVDAEGFMTWKLLEMTEKLCFICVIIKSMLLASAYDVLDCCVHQYDSHDHSSVV